MPKVAIVAHDAGGAEILSALVRQHPDWQPAFVLQGPALAIFERKLGPLTCTTLDMALQEADWIITGTGWQSELEWQAICQANWLAKPVVAYLDHWVNYRARFVRKGQTCLPGQIWVGDADALRIATAEFPEVRIVLHANPYFAEIVASFAAWQQAATDGNDVGEVNKASEINKTATAQQAAANTTTSGPRLLYVCEPIAEHAQSQFGNPRHWGYTEFDALDFFLQYAATLAPAAQEITIRPHPSEAKDKYSAILQNCQLPLKIGGASPLTQEILAADMVFGCNSMALIIAHLARKQVFCCIPPGGPACTLPLQDIQLLRALAH